MIKVQYFHECHYYSEFNFLVGYLSTFNMPISIPSWSLQLPNSNNYYILHIQSLGGRKKFLSSYYLQIIWRWFLGQYILLQLDTHPVKVFISPHFITAGNFPPETLVRNSAGWSCCHRMGHWNTPGHTQICWREVGCLSSRVCKCLMFKRCQAKWYRYCRIKGMNFLIP